MIQEKRHITSYPVFAPNNYKQGRLINGTYRAVDFAFLLGGIILSLILFFIVLFVFVPKISLILLCFSPALLTFFLTSRHAYYHNNLELLKIIFKYERNQKEYFGYVKDRGN